MKYTILLMGILLCGCVKEKVGGTSFDVNKLKDKWWYLSYWTGTINYRFNGDGTANIVHDYNFAVNGGINYRWKGKNDSLILLAGIFTFSEFDKWKVISINDSVLTLSKDSVEFSMYDTK
jgi:hypothetical protein